MPSAKQHDAEQLSAPFPYYGGKRRVAPIIWKALGDPTLYIEPFIGSAAALLGRPLDEGFPGGRLEIINDADAFVANLWRSIKHDPAAVARRCDHPLSELDMLARHRRLCDHKRKRRLVERMGLEPEYFDAVAAGDWLYLKSAWIGGGICEAEWFGPGDARNRGTCINAGKIPQLNVNGVFARSRRQAVTKIITALSARLRHLSITCGDWSRIFFPSLMQKHRCGIFLDPPYAHSTGRDKTLYRIEMESTDGVAEFCRRHGKKKNVRIVLAGLDGEYDLPGWRVIPWSASHCFGRDEKSGKRHLERLWISPHCQPVDVADAPHRHTKGARWRPRSKPPTNPARRRPERSSSRTR